MSKGSELVNHLLNENPDNITLDAIMSMALTATFDRQLDRGLGIDPIFAFLAILTADRNATVTLNEIQDDQITNPGIYEPDPPAGTRIEVEIDTGGFNSPVSFDADGGAFIFVDDAMTFNNVVINNFSSDDSIRILNGNIDDYFISCGMDETDVTISYNNNGTMNIMQLTGIVTIESTVNDQQTLVAAMGFDPFLV